MSLFDTEAYTFDDVLLLPGYSEVLPGQVSLRTRLVREIWLNIPVISAAMDTVTEADLALARSLSHAPTLAFVIDPLHRFFVLLEVCSL